MASVIAVANCLQFLRVASQFVCLFGVFGMGASE